MFLRPRCREWTPLSTQQLRLRSLIQIVGYNIRPPETCTAQCSFYLTLHHTTMSAPFYTSERISSPHPKWKEIDSELTQCTSCANIVVRIWSHEIQPSGSENTSQNVDTIIQTWGVYFSGLRYIGANLTLNFTSDCFKSNTLVFQMHGGYFCSYKSLKLDVIPPENEIEHGSLSSDSSGKTNPNSKPTIESKLIQNHRFLKESRSISPSKLNTREKEYSKSQSPVEKGFKQHFPSIRSLSSLNIAQNQRRKDDSDRKVLNNHIYEHAPNDTDIGEFSKNSPENSNLSNSKIDLSETAENYDLRNENDWCPKYRYLVLNFLNSEVRPSYNATKLQKLHLLQYSIKKRQEAVRDIKERIYKKSAMTNMFDAEELNENKLKKSFKSQRNLFSQEDSDVVSDAANSDALRTKTVDYKAQVTNGPRLTLKLNDLLSFNSKPSPFQRAEHYRLTKQLEILRFKRIILNDETDSKLASIRKLKEKYSKLIEETQDVGTELMQDYHSLSRLSESLKETKQSAIALRELASRSHKSLVSRRAELLNDLQSIFHIEQKDEVTWSICGANLPVCESSPYDRAMSGASVMSGMSAAAGFSAQCLAICAHISDIPLRYALRLRGSATIVMDIANHVPDNNIPLFARGGDVTLFRYGLFLLNKCIAQMMTSRALHVTDMRPTLANLKRIMTTPPSPEWCGGAGRCPRAASVRSMAPDRLYGRQFNRFKDSVEGHSPHSLMSLQRHRLSRSVGSYQDDNELSIMDASTSSIVGSEPNIYKTKLATDNTDEQTKIPDRELEKTEDKVTFTLGEDTELVGVCVKEKLVRISSNNNDEVCPCIDDSVKQICTEIKDYCCSAENDLESSDVLGNKNEAEIDVTKEVSAKIDEGLDEIVKINAAFENLAQNDGKLEVAADTNDAKGISAENNVTAEILSDNNAIIDIEDSRTCEDCESNVDGVCVDFKCANAVDEEVIVIQSSEANLDTGQESLNLT